MKHTVKSKTSGKALLVNPKKLIAAARAYRAVIRNNHASAIDPVRFPWRFDAEHLKELFLDAVDEYEAKLRKGGRKP